MCLGAVPRMLEDFSVFSGTVVVVVDMNDCRNFIRAGVLRFCRLAELVSARKEKHVREGPCIIVQGIPSVILKTSAAARMADDGER